MLRAGVTILVNVGSPGSAPRRVGRECEVARWPGAYAGGGVDGEAGGQSGGRPGIAGPGADKHAPPRRPVAPCVWGGWAPPAAPAGSEAVAGAVGCPGPSDARAVC